MRELSALMQECHRCRWVATISMRLRRHAVYGVLAVLGLVLVGGCQLPGASGGSSLSKSPLVAPANDAQGAAGRPGKTPAETSATALANNSAPTTADGSVAAPQTKEEALAGVLDQLQQIGAVDPQAQQQLMTDLRNAKPEHWSLIVEQFQAALAYRQQLTARKSQDPAEPLVAQNQLPRSSKTPPVFPSKSNGAATPVSFDAKGRRTVVKSQAAVARPDSQRAASIAVATDAKPAQDALPENAPANSVQPLPPPPAHSVPTSPDPTSAGADASQPPVVQQASYVSPLAASSPWQDPLHAAIAALEQSVKPTPGSIEEVQEHMRLRMLYLLAGQEEDALLPIPGATAAQQDYWAKQMFALSTFLDSARQPDDMRRAAGALVYLDQARAKLAELATLQVRNLSFVNSVEGFGVYEPRKETKFHPGDQVTLYAEVGNFRSDSTEKGYRTALATSYQVLDKNGQRVDGGQFPEVEDLCHNLRHDFHMQYGVALPTRIYPGQYELRLIITDQQSHKIGQGSLPFEIVE